MTSYEIVATGPFRHDQLEIEYLPGSSMPLDTSVQLAIDRGWGPRLARARQENVPMYDGALYRVAGHAVDHGRLLLRLGDTSYKEYVGTRLPAFFARRSRDMLANPLAVCVALITDDARIVVGFRQGVDVANGQYGVIGGFPERGKDVDPFAAIARELYEETGLAIPADRFTCLGMIYDCVHPHFELCFAVNAGLSLHQLQHLNPSDREAARFAGVPDNQGALDAFLSQRDRLSPTTEGCLELHRRVAT